MKKYRFQKLRIWALLTLFLLLSIANVKAVHVSGGSIHWKTTANGDSLEVDVITYADCNGTAYNDGVLYLSSNKKSKSYTTLKIKSTRFISNICSTYCTPCSSSSCSNKVGFQEIIYTQKVLLSDFVDSKNCRIDFAYSDCCRPTNFTTADSKNKSMILNAWVNLCESAKDNSPLINDSLVQALDIGRVLWLDFSMTDLDADSLQYSIDSVSSLHWNKGFNSEKPFTGEYLLDPRFGIFQMIARRVEISAISIKVSSFNNGKVVSETRREYPYYVYGRSSPDYITDSKSTKSHSLNLIALKGDSFKMKWNATKEIYIPKGVSPSYFKKSATNQLKMEFVPDSNDLGVMGLIIKTNNQKCPYNFINSPLVKLWVLSKSDTTFKILREPYKDACGSYKFFVPKKFYSYYKDIDWYVNDTFSHSGIVYYPKLTKTDTTKIKIVFKIGSHQFTDSIVFIPHSAPNALLTLEPINVGSICADSLVLKMKTTGDNGSNRYYWDVSNIGIKYTEELKIDFSSVSTKTDFMIFYRVTDKEGCAEVGIDTLSVNPFTLLNIQNDSTLCDSGNYDFRINSPYPGGIWTSDFVTDSNLFEGNKLGFKQKNTVYYKNLNPKYCLKDEAVFKLRKSARIQFTHDTIACINNNPISLTANPPDGKFSGKGIQIIDSIYKFANFNKSSRFTIYYEFENPYGCISLDSNYISIINDTLKIPPITTIWCQNDSNSMHLPLLSKYDSWQGDSINDGPLANDLKIKWPKDTSLASYKISYTATRPVGCYASKEFEIDFISKPNIVFNRPTVCLNTKTLLKATPNIGAWYSPFIIRDSFFKYSLALNSDSIIEIPYKLNNYFGCDFEYSSYAQVYPFAQFKMTSVDGSVCQTDEFYPLPIPNKFDSFLWAGRNVFQDSNGFRINRLNELAHSNFHGYEITVHQIKRCSSTQKFNIYISPPVKADFAISSTQGLAPLRVNLKADADNSHNFKWIGLDDNLDTFKSRFTNYTYTKAGIYSVGLVVSNNDCIDTLLKKDIISVEPNSVKTPSGYAISLYPNPAMDVIRISSNKEVLAADLYNLTGQHIMHFNLHQNEPYLDISSLKSGVYLIELHFDGEQPTMRQTLIKTKQ